MKEYIFIPSNPHASASQVEAEDEHEAALLFKEQGIDTTHGTIVGRDRL